MTDFKKMREKMIARKSARAERRQQRRFERSKQERRNVLETLREKHSDFRSTLQTKQENRKSKIFVKEVSQLSLNETDSRRMNSEMGKWFDSNTFSDVTTGRIDEGFYKDNTARAITTMLSLSTNQTLLSIDDLKNKPEDTDVNRAVMNKIGEFMADYIAKINNNPYNNENQRSINLSTFIEHCDQAIEYNYEYAEVFVSALRHLRAHPGLSPVNHDILTYHLDPNSAGCASEKLLNALEGSQTLGYVENSSMQIINNQERIEEADFHDEVDSSISLDDTGSSGSQSSSEQDEHELLSINDNTPLSASQSHEDQVIERIADLLDSNDADVSKLFSINGKKEKNHAIADKIGIRKGTTQLMQDQTFASEYDSEIIAIKAVHEKKMVDTLIKDLYGEIDETKHVQNKAETEYSKRLDSLKHAEQNLDQKKANYNESIDELEGAKSLCKHYESVVKKVEDKMISFESEVDRGEKTDEELEAMLSEIKQEFAKAENDVYGAKATIQTKAQQCEHADKEVEKAKENVVVSQKACDQVATDINTLKDRRHKIADVQKALGSESRKLNRIIKSSELKGVKGVAKRVGHGGYAKVQKAKGIVKKGVKEQVSKVKERVAHKWMKRNKVDSKKNMENNESVKKEPGNDDTSLKR